MLSFAPHFIITGICELQVRQELAPAIPSIFCKRVHDALDTVLGLRFWRADTLHCGVGRGEALSSLAVLAPARTVPFFFRMIATLGTVIVRCRGAKHPDGERECTVGQLAPRSMWLSGRRLESMRQFETSQRVGARIEEGARDGRQNQAGQGGEGENSRFHFPGRGGARHNSQFWKTEPRK
jgi:hypothetical protein